MALEQRLRDELSRSADSIRSETDLVLAQVILVARRRQRARRGGTAFLIAAVMMAGVVGISRLDVDNLGRRPAPATRSSGLTQWVGSNLDGHAALRNAVTGVWQSSSRPSRQVRVAIKAAGFTDADANRALGNAAQWQAQIFFSFHGNGPVVITKTWDPSNPGVSLRIDDPIPYKLLPRDRLLLSPVASPTELMFSYRIVGDRLTLHYQGASPHPLRNGAAARIIAWTSAPLTMVH